MNSTQFILKPISNIGNVKMCVKGHIFTDSHLTECIKCIETSHKTHKNKNNKIEVSNSIETFKKELPNSFFNLFNLNDFETTIIIKHKNKTLSLNLILKSE